MKKKHVVLVAQWQRSGWQRKYEEWSRFTVVPFVYESSQGNWSHFGTTGFFPWLWPAFETGPHVTGQQVRAFVSN